LHRYVHPCLSGVEAEKLLACQAERMLIRISSPLAIAIAYCKSDVVKHCKINYKEKVEAFVCQTTNGDIEGSLHHVMKTLSKKKFFNYKIIKRDSNEAPVLFQDIVGVSLDNPANHSLSERVSKDGAFVSSDFFSFFFLASAVVDELGPKSQHVEGRGRCGMAEISTAVK
jgi:hypothetical protein